MTTRTYQDGFEIEYDATPENELDTLRARPDESKNDDSRQINAPRNTSLTTILRTFGACAVIASLSLFLIEGWTDGNDLNRYLKLLAQTGLITGAGIFLSFVVKEAKGARVFFGLGLVSAVANFTILGALTYSMFQFDNGLVDYPSMLKWQAVSIGELLPLAAGAIVLLTLLARFSFSIFARNSAAKLTVSFLALNALLLVPAREAVYVSALAVIALFSATQITLGVVKRKELMLTAEAKYALACLFLPGLIIVARALGLYAVDEIVLLSLTSLIYYALRSISLITQGNTAKQVLAVAQYVSGLVAAGLLSSLVPASFGEISVTVFSIAALGVTFDQVKLQLAAGPGLPKAFISITTVGLVVLNVINALLMPTLGFTMLSVLSMIGLLTLIQLFAPKVAELRTNQLLALIGLAITSLLLIVRLVSMLNVGSWVLIGGLGIALIILASLYDRFGLTFKLPSTSIKA